MGNSDHGTAYMRVGGDDGELRPWHCIYVNSIEHIARKSVTLSAGASYLPTVLPTVGPMDF